MESKRVLPPATHFVHRETVRVPLQRLLCVLESLEHQLLLALGLQARLLRQVAGRSGQPPQELGVVAFGGRTNGTQVWRLNISACNLNKARPFACTIAI